MSKAKAKLKTYKAWGIFAYGKLQDIRVTRRAARSAKCVGDTIEPVTVTRTKKEVRK